MTIIRIITGNLPVENRLSSTLSLPIDLRQLEFYQEKDTDPAIWHDDRARCPYYYQPGSSAFVTFDQTFIAYFSVQLLRFAPAHSLKSDQSGKMNEIAVGTICV